MRETAYEAAKGGVCATADTATMWIPFYIAQVQASRQEGVAESLPKVYQQIAERGIRHTPAALRDGFKEFGPVRFISGELYRSAGVFLATSYGPSLILQLAAKATLERSGLSNQQAAVAAGGTVGSVFAIGTSQMTLGRSLHDVTKMGFLNLIRSTRGTGPIAAREAISCFTFFSSFQNELLEKLNRKGLTPVTLNKALVASAILPPLAIGQLLTRISAVQQRHPEKKLSAIQTTRILWSEAKQQTPLPKGRGILPKAVWLAHCGGRAFGPGMALRLLALSGTNQVIQRAEKFCDKYIKPLFGMSE